MIEPMLTLDFKETMKRANLMENAAHNGGWLFNKFIGRVFFDTATAGVNPKQVQVAFQIHETSTAILKLDFSEKANVPEYDWIEVINDKIDIIEVNTKPGYDDEYNDDDEEESETCEECGEYNFECECTTCDDCGESEDFCECGDDEEPEPAAPFAAYAANKRRDATYKEE